MLRLIPKNQQKRQIPPELASLGLPERLLELLLDREIDTPEKIERYLHPKREDLVDPMLMQDMDKAVNVIRDAIEKHEEITVFGDYDVDGVTATAILLTYLRKQGAQVGFYIPDRHGEGYGLNIAAIEQIATHSKLLITVDCGITCGGSCAGKRAGHACDRDRSPSAWTADSRMRSRTQSAFRSLSVPSTVRRRRGL